MNAQTVSTHWWLNAPALTADAMRPSLDARRGTYQLGDVMLEVDSTYAPIADELESSYGDCRIASAKSAHRVVCSARTTDRLVALRFEGSSAAPHLCTVASTVTRPRADQQNFVLRALETPGWQYVANLLDEDEPLMASDTRTALFNPKVEPPEFLLNFVIGVAQLSQDSTLFVHGGALSIGGRGTLIVGRSGQGKSTTSAAVAARGHALFGDETVGIRAHSREIVPFRRTLKVRPGPQSAWVKQRLEARPYGIRRDASGVECAWVRPSEMFPGVAAPAPVPLTDVFFLRDFSKAAAVRRFEPKLPSHLDEFQALTMSLSAVASWPFSPAHRALRFARIADVFSGCNCYFLDLGTPDETAELIERTVLDHVECA